jgi:hypothetical protein
MLTALVLFTALAHAEAKPQVSCRAVFRSLDEKSNTVESSVELTSRPAGMEQVRHVGSLEGKSFLVTEEKNDLFAQIFTPGELAKGLNVRGAPDSQGRFSASEVTGTQVYRLECQRQRN